MDTFARDDGCETESDDYISPIGIFVYIFSLSEVTTGSATIPNRWIGSKGWRFAIFLQIEPANVSLLAPLTDRMLGPNE